MNFRIGNIRDYSAPVSPYAPPVKIGHYSTDSKHKFYDDDHQMKYLSMPTNLLGLNWDLNEGYSKYVGECNDEEDPHNTINKILRWITCHKEDVGKLFALEDPQKRKTSFICKRNALMAIMSTKYERYDDWTIYATKFRSFIYLCRIKKDEQEEMTDDQRRQGSWGYKFEQYMTTDPHSSDTKPDTSLPVNVNEKYFVVVKGKLGNHDILFIAETDAMDPKVASKSMDCFVEFKTRNLPDTEKSYTNLRWKCLKWYLQSYIIGIPRLICGFKNRNGIVKEIKVYEVSELPKKAKNLWSPDVCLNFTSCFLSFVKQRVKKDDPKVVYKFYWAPGKSSVTCEELTPEYQFLPEWYIKEMSTL